MLDVRNTDSCARCSGAMPGLLPVDEAVALSLRGIRPVTGCQTVSLNEAVGRVANCDVAAQRAMPFFDNSAMDGFALRRADLDARLSLPVAGTVAAGDAPHALPAGRALRIFTGAPVPAGADAVVMAEQCREANGTVQFETTPAPGQNIRRKGSDQAVGQVLIRKGTRIGPHHIGLLAANGMTSLEVIRRPRVGVFSTGDELVCGTGIEVSEGQIPDANRPLLLSLAAWAGADVTDLGILPDDAEATACAMDGLGDDFDLIVTSGAVSMGGKDHIRDALVAAGGSIEGWRVAVKPGKPVMFGRLRDCIVTSLPGNPFAVFVGLHLFVGPQIAALSGARPEAFAPVPARAGFNWHRKPGRTEVFPAKLIRYDTDGCAVVDRLGHGVSATLLPVAEADGLHASQPAPSA